MTNYTAETLNDDLRYLELLARSFPTIADASTEIINLEAILNLPKGTEHFLTDIHGEYEAFQHVLKNASGTIKRKVSELFGNSLRESEKKDLCTLIYYPEEKLELIKAVETDIDDWYLMTMNQLVQVCRTVSSKYSRSKVRKALPDEFSYIIQELLHENATEPNHNKLAYVNGIFNSIVSTRRADSFIVAMANLIQRLVIDSLHIVGDIYDRGPGAHIIMDTLCTYHNFDIQWGNHDIIWMGAACGNLSCMANVIRISMRYANLTTLEDGYGINLLPLATFAMDTYVDDPCTIFWPKVKYADEPYDDKTVMRIAQMQKAISIIQFKLEAEIISRRPEYKMQDRNLLHLIDFEKGVLKYGGKEYKMLDMNFPTIDPKNPYKLTDQEKELMDKISFSFMNSEKLHRHMRCMYANGSMYKVANGNLLYHASIPLDEKFKFKEVLVGKEKLSGKALLDRIDQLVRTAYFAEESNPEKQFAQDYMWYLWCGKDAPTFDKSKMATFERYFIAEKELHKEIKGHYYTARDKEEVCDMILEEFNVHAKYAHIINGHVPVKIKKGEDPLKAGGKLLVIDGGFSKAYQPETGIAGYTLIFNSRGIQLVQHEPFESRQKAIEEGIDIISTSLLVEMTTRRMMVKDTDIGGDLRKQIKDLEKLLVAYRLGLVKQKPRKYPKLFVK